MAKKPRRKKALTYHGRKGRPVIHKSRTGRKYIMVRKRDGVKRLYAGSKYRTNGITRRLRL